METARKVWIAASGTIGAVSVGLIAFDFSTSSPLFALGQVGVVVAVAFGLAGVFSCRRQNIDDAFEAGYQAGYHRGQRVKPKLVRLPSERDQARTSRQ